MTSDTRAVRMNMAKSKMGVAWSLGGRFMQSASVGSNTSMSPSRITVVKFTHSRWTGNIGGLTLAPGLYKWGSSVTIPADVTISGCPNDVWIFQMSGNFSISASKRATLAGGAQAKNIFWQAAEDVTLGSGASFTGNVLTQSAVIIQTGATLNGCTLAQTRVTLDAAVVTKSCSTCRQ